MTAIVILVMVGFVVLMVVRSVRRKDPGRPSGRTRYNDSGHGGYVTDSSSDGDGGGWGGGDSGGGDSGGGGGGD